MATNLEITQAEVDERSPSFYNENDKALVRKSIAREKLEAAVRELPGSRYKALLLFMFEEGLV